MHSVLLQIVFAELILEDIIESSSIGYRVINSFLKEGRRPEMKILGELLAEIDRLP
jgi:hypothetical protein